MSNTASSVVKELHKVAKKGRTSPASPFNVDEICSTYVFQLQTNPFWLPLLAKPALADDEAVAALRRNLTYRLNGSNRSVIRV